MKNDDFTFWLRWMLANALGEAIGVSAPLLIGFGILEPQMSGLTGTWSAVLVLVAGVLLGVSEGTVVGAAQGAVLRLRLPRLALRTWIIATVIGAMVAWGLGMLPSTLMSADTGGQAATEMPQWLTFVMAAGMGAVAGTILALAQWVALRAQVHRARLLWLLANALAWLCGIPPIFPGMGVIPADATVLQALPIVVAATAVAGAVVGAIHGWFLVKVLLVAPKLPAETVVAD